MDSRVKMVTPVSLELPVHLAHPVLLVSQE